MALVNTDIQLPNTHLKITIPEGWAHTIRPPYVVLHSPSLPESEQQLIGTPSFSGTPMGECIITTPTRLGEVTLQEVLLELWTERTGLDNTPDQTRMTIAGLEVLSFRWTDGVGEIQSWVVEAHSTILEIQYSVISPHTPELSPLDVAHLVHHLISTIATLH